MVNRDNPAHKKLLQAQTAESKATQAKHSGEMDKKQKQQQKEVITLQNQHQHNRQLLEKQHQAAQLQQGKNQQKELDQLTKKEFD